MTVAGKTIGKIDKGFFVLVGVKKGDTLQDAEMLATKLAKLRIMADQAGKMNLTVTDIGGEFLVVSQFTLYADTSAGNRPSFINAALPDEAKKIYNFFIKKLKSEHFEVATGNFGDYMEISCLLDGPVTIVLEN